MVAATRSPAYEVAAGTPDPEIPTLTIEDLGILRSVDYSSREGVVVTITPPSGAIVVLDGPIVIAP